jgi:hypothetical protein
MCDKHHVQQYLSEVVVFSLSWRQLKYPNKKNNQSEVSGGPDHGLKSNSDSIEATTTVSINIVSTVFYMYLSVLFYHVVL